MDVPSFEFSIGNIDHNRAKTKLLLYVVLNFRVVTREWIGSVGIKRDRRKRGNRRHTFSIKTDSELVMGICYASRFS